MNRFAYVISILAAFAASSVSAQTQDRPLSEILTDPIANEREVSVTHVPVEIRNGKLHIEATMDGQTRKFLFDTGSPTVLAKHFADTLDLEVIGQNTGVDSHGNQVAMDFVIVDRLTLGDITFRKVPVLVHDFSDNDMGRCVIGNGLIGSEIFSGNAWRIDTQAKRLSIAGSASELPAPSGETLRTTLYDTGYPHAPIVGYAVGDLADKALFDTGNSANISFFENAASHPSVQGAIVPGTRVQGEGYEGESAGGVSESGPLKRFKIANVSFPSGTLDATQSIVRAMPPTLLGAGLLQSYIVTLDYPGRQMVLEKRTEPDAVRPAAGYGIAMIGGRTIVARLFAGSAAERAGLKLGDHVIEAQGRPLTQIEGSGYCDTVNWLVGEFDPRDAAELVVQREDGPHRFSLPAVD